MSQPDDKPAAPADEELTPEVKAAFAMVVARLEKRRKINLTAYLLAFLVMVGGIIGSLFYIAAAPGEFRGWILLVPLGVTGLIFSIFGRWAKRV